MLVLINLAQALPAIGPYDVDVICIRLLGLLEYIRQTS